MGYNRLFPQPAVPTTSTSNSPEELTKLLPDPRFFPKTSEEKSVSEIDKVFAERVSKEVLLRTKAMQMAIDFLTSRAAGAEDISKLFDTIYQKLKHGTTERTGVSQGVYR